MPVFIPRRGAVGVAKEVTPGTYVSPAFWSPFQKFDLADDPGITVDDSAIGTVEEAFDAQALYSMAKGSWESFIYDEPFGLPLLSLFGSVSTAANADASTLVQDHTFTVSQTNTRPSLSFTEKTPIHDVNYTMGVVSKLEITAEAKAFAKFSADVISKGSAANSPSSTPAVTIENKFIPSGITLKIADTVAGLSGGTTIQLKSIKISFENGAKDDPDSLGYSGPAGMISETFKSSVALEGLYRDDTLRTLALAGTKKAVGIYLTNSAVTIGTAAHPGLTFLFEPGFFNPWSKSTDLNTAATQSTTFNGLYSTSNSKSLSV